MLISGIGGLGHMVLQYAKATGARVIAVDVSEEKSADRGEEQEEDSDPRGDRPRCLARCYNVFNASQVDGYVPKITEQLPESVRIENADRFFSSLPAAIKHGGDRGFYSPTGDFIQNASFGAVQISKRVCINSRTRTCSLVRSTWSTQP